MFGKKKSMFKEMAAAAAEGVAMAKEKPPKPPKRPKEITIREADNGFIVVADRYGITAPGEDAPKDKVYSDIAGLHSCIDEVFGKGKAKEEKADKEYA